MLRGLRMARIRPSRLRILNAGVKIRIGFTKKSFFQKMSKKSEKIAKSQNSTPNYVDKLPIHRLGGPILNNDMFRKRLPFKEAIHSY